MTRLEQAQLALSKLGIDVADAVIGYECVVGFFRQNSQMTEDEFRNICERCKTSEGWDSK